MGSWTEMRPIPSVPHGLNRSCGCETLSPLAQAPSGPSLPIPIPRGRTHQSLTSGRTVECVEEGVRWKVIFSFSARRLWCWAKALPRVPAWRSHRPL